MSRRKLNLRIEPVLQGLLAGDGSPDDATRTILHAAKSLMHQYGLRRWTMDDVADRAAIGRTSVYRVFGSRDDLLHAVLAQELRDTVALVMAAAASEATPEAKLVAGAAAGLRALPDSLAERLLQTDPGTFLPFLMTHASTLVAIARDAIAMQLQALDPSLEAGTAREIGEAAARLGLSFVLARETILPVDDPEALRRSMGNVLRLSLAPARA